MKAIFLLGQLKALKSKLNRYLLFFYATKLHASWPKNLNKDNL